MFNIFSRILYFALFFNALVHSFNYSAPYLDIKPTTVMLTVYLLSLLFILFLIKIFLFYFLQFKNETANKILLIMCFPFFSFYFQENLKPLSKYFKFQSSIIKYHYYIVFFTAILILLAIILWRILKFTDLEMSNKKIKYYLFFLVFGWYLMILPTTIIHGLHGDEINHIWLADSIKNDFDVNLINNTPPDKLYLITQYFFKNNNSEVYTNVMPGIAVSGFVFYIIFGAAGLRLLIIIASSLLAIFIFEYSLEKNIKPKNAFIAVIILFFLHPIALYSSQIYPELPACLFALLTLIFIRKNKPVIAGIICGLIIWLHIKYLILITLLFFILIFIYSKNKNNIFKFSGAFLIGFIPFEFYVYSIYGSFNPFSAFIYGSDSATGSFLELLKINVLSNSFFKQLYLNLFDLQFGLFINNPVYIFICAGVIYCLLKKSKQYKELLILIFVYSFYIFINNKGYNGYSPLNRLLTPVLPLTAPLFAEFITYFLSSDFKYKKIFLTLVYLILLFSFLITAIFILIPSIRYPDYFGRNAFYTLYSRF